MDSTQHRLFESADTPQFKPREAAKTTAKKAVEHRKHGDACSSIRISSEVKKAHVSYHDAPEATPAEMHTGLDTSHRGLAQCLHRK